MAPIKKKAIEEGIGELGKSTVVEKDLRRLEWEKTVGGKKKKECLFYRNFVFKCGKCIHEFEHTTEIGEIEHKVICPECDEEHILRIRPVSKNYDVKIPRTVELVK